MTAIDGQNPIGIAEDPKVAVARAVYDHQAEPGDAPFDELDEQDRALLAENAAAHISAHMQLLEKAGFRILPPGALPRPKSDEEAGAMLVAVRAYREGKKRKGGLLVGERKLVLPKGTRLQ